ncbi:hypothetical protein D9M71_309520 [compost metagenome]
MENLDAGGGHHAEHCEAGSAEYGRRNRGHQERRFGQQAEADQEGSRGHRHIAAAHAGHLHQADVLGEGRMGEGIEEARQKRGSGVAQQAATQCVGADFAAGDLAQGEEHAGGLDEDDHHHQAHGQHRGQLELRHAEMQGLHHLEPGRLVQAVQVDHAARAGQGIAQRHADQHRDIHPEALEEAIHQEDGAQHQGGDGQVLQGAELAGLVAAARPVHRDREEGEADGGDHRAGHQRREEAHDARHEGRDQQAEETGGDGGAEDSLDAHAGHPGHHHHAADGGETGAHHHRHADADCANAEGLHQGGDAGDQQVGVNKEGDFFAGEAGRLADDQRNGNGAAIHQQHVLETDQQELQQRQALIDSRAADAALRYLGHATPRVFIVVSR